MFTGYGTLNVTADGAVLRVEINRPQDGNRLTGAVVEELLSVLDELGAGERGIRVLVLSGAGDHFSVGGDLTELRELAGRGRADARALRAGVRVGRLVERLSGIEDGVVSVAVVRGYYAGAGLALAAACHLRLAADDSRGWLPELARGVPPVWGGSLRRLTREVGRSRVRHLLLSRERLTADAALQAGLVHQVVPAAGLDRAVTRVVNAILRGDQAATLLALELIERPVGGGADAVLLDAFLRPE